MNTTQSFGFQTLSLAILKLLIAFTALLAVALISSGPRAAGAAERTVAQRLADLESRVGRLETLQADIGTLRQAYRAVNGGTLPLHVAGFGANSAELTPSMKARLDKVVEAVNAEKPSELRVVGYASDGGKPEDNVKLATTRALAAREYVVARLKATAPLPVVAALAPTPGSPVAIPSVPTAVPVVADDAVKAYVGGQTTDFGSESANRAVVVKLIK